MGGMWSWIQRMGDDDEKYEFPNTLEGFGLRFNEDGELRQIENDEPFEFEVRPDDHKYNQKRYNALGDVVTEYIYRVMERTYKLQKAFMPADVEENEPQSFVYISGDLFTNEDKLMVLIHGSGAVRPGQWARRLIINDSLDKGSQLPYIKWARENGYALVVANTNYNTAEVTVKGKKKKEEVRIRGSATPEEHVESIWHEFVQRSRAKNVAIVAHSFGGICTVQLATRHIREFEDRVFAIALTDSVHNYKQQHIPDVVKDFYLERAMNWASAYDGLDAPLQVDARDCPTVSAGTDKHEYTSYFAKESLCAWLKEKYDERIQAKNRVSTGEPQNAHYRRPASSEAQPLGSRSRGVGEESPERPKNQPANQKPSSGEGDASMEQPGQESASQKSDDLMSFDEEPVKSDSNAVQLEKELLSTDEKVNVPKQQSENSDEKAKVEL